MPILTVKRYSRKEIQDNLDFLYIFGDNYERIGFGGQAKEARGEPNAVGIRTKRKASYGQDAFLGDETYYENCAAIIEDFAPIATYLKIGGAVVWPADGIGTGLAKLQEFAPATLEFINNLMYMFEQLYGVA